MLLDYIHQDMLLTTLKSQLERLDGRADCHVAYEALAQAPTIVMDDSNATQYVVNHLVRQGALALEESNASSRQLLTKAITNLHCRAGIGTFIASVFLPNEDFEQDNPLAKSMCQFVAHSLGLNIRGEPLLKSERRPAVGLQLVQSKIPARDLAFPLQL